MIINHQYKFCFFQIPRTGSTAIAKVLIETYGSEQIYHKHSSYEHFIKNCSIEERKYFMFAGIRNPLDSILSQYIKMKNDSDGKFSRGYFNNGKPISPGAIDKYKFIKEQNASFEDFFMKYVSSSFFKSHQETTIDNMNFIIRFDHLQDDFSKIMKSLNIHDVAIPHFNKTKGRDKDYSQYYTPRMRSYALKNLENIMTKYNFEFPSEWD